jgi:hypothetical protein
MRLCLFVGFVFARALMEIVDKSVGNLVTFTSSRPTYKVFDSHLKSEKFLSTFQHIKIHCLPVIRGESTTASSLVIAALNCDCNGLCNVLYHLEIVAFCNSRKQCGGNRAQLRMKPKSSCSKWPIPPFTRSQVIETSLRSACRRVDSSRNVSHFPFCLAICM